MMKVILLGLVLVVSACAYRQQPIYAPSNAMPSAIAGKSLDRIGASIERASTPHNWTMRTVAPGRIQASHAQDRMSANVEIVFDARSWRIEYRSSMGLFEKDGRIHSHYNVWVRNLEQDIAAQLALVQP